MNRTAWVWPVVVGALLFTGCGGSGPTKSAPSAAAPTPTVTPSASAVIVDGNLSIPYDDVHYDDKGALVFPAPGALCAGKGGYSDIAGGTQVVVSDETGSTVALGNLLSGSYDEHRCKFNFVITGIPSGHPFYKIEVSHRGGVQYTATQLTRPLALTLG